MPYQNAAQSLEQLRKENPPGNYPQVVKRNNFEGLLRRSALVILQSGGAGKPAFLSGRLRQTAIIDIVAK